MKTAPTPYGANPALDALYTELGDIEQREFDAIEFGRPDLLPSIRESMVPLKRRINAMEGFELYDNSVEVARLDKKLSDAERDLTGLPDDDSRRVPFLAEYARAKTLLFSTTNPNQPRP